MPHGAQPGDGLRGLSTGHERRAGFGPTSFGIFDAFPDESGREAHLNGKVAQALEENVGTLFEQPTFEQVDVLFERPPE